MADSSFEKGLAELSKMKVADLKAELKQRGLPTTGNKNELVERLHLAIQDSSLSLDEAADEILDEDAVLDDEELETEELDVKPDSLTTEVDSKKRKVENEESKVPPKKIILNRNNKIEEVKVDDVQKKDDDNEKSKENVEAKVIKTSNVSNERLAMRAKKFGMPLTEAAKKEMRAARFNATPDSNGTSIDNKSAVIVKTATVTPANGKEEDKIDSEKKIIKLSELSVVERLEMRAKKFGVPLSDLAKKEARAARFNVNSNNKSASSIKNSPEPASLELLKKRAERFGTNVSSLLDKAEIEAKKEQRKARFGEIKPVEKATVAKIKLV